MTRAGSGFSGSFVSGFPTARLGFTLRRGHEATEHLSTGDLGSPLFRFGLFVNRRLIIWKTIGEPAGARLGKAP